MRFVYSYIRLFIASWMFLGGVAIQFVPSPAAVERGIRDREQRLQAVLAEERAEWLRARDMNDSSSEAYLRLFGVLLGGVGFAAALFEAAYVCARSSRHCPLDTT
jgi:hypothetical protein